MGIPVYFKTLVSEYSDKILHKDKYDDIDSLFFDLNCLIHPSVRGMTDEDEMISKILFDINKLIEYSGVRKLVYIAIDGIAPSGKMKQQRQRRFRSEIERKYSSSTCWNTNAISPGTIFMRKLNESLKVFIKTLSVKCILSDSDERGEGEHKILHYIKNNDLQGSDNNKICIYGLDADLIMLSLVSRKNNIVLLRERTDYNIENTDNEYIYLKIDPLKEHIIESLGLEYMKDTDGIIDDYIFICFLLGNDFMNHIPSLNLRYGGHDLLLNIYSKLQYKYQGYYQLIDQNKSDLIHMTFFKEFVREISLKEKITMNKILSIRSKQAKRIHNEYNKDFKKLYSESGTNISLDDIYRYQSSQTSESSHKMIENLPMIFQNKEKKIYENMKYDNELCQDYMKSLVWTTHYYFDKCCDWHYHTLYNEAPLVEHFSKYLILGQVMISFNQDDKEFTNEEQLSYIFPPSSHKLHQYDIIGKEYQLIPHLSFNRYLWECGIEFI